MAAYMQGACALLLLPLCEKTASSLPDTIKLLKGMTQPDSPHLIHPEATLNLWSRISGNPASGLDQAEAGLPCESDLLSSAAISSKASRRGETEPSERRSSGARDSQGDVSGASSALDVPHWRTSENFVGKWSRCSLQGSCGAERGHFDVIDWGS